MLKNIDTVLMDVDGTITSVKMDVEGDDKSCLDILIEIMREKESISYDEALEKLNAQGNIETTCLFSFLDQLGVAKQEYWNRLRTHFARSVFIPEDSSTFIKAIKQPNPNGSSSPIKLYSATTNSRMATLLKLSLGDLADIDGSLYFDGYFGGDSFNDPDGKFSSSFFPSILKAGKFDPERTMMIGDDEKWDLENALTAGIKHVVIIDREMSETMFHKNGAIYVNRLTALL